MNTEQRELLMREVRQRLEPLGFERSRYDWYGTHERVVQVVHLELRRPVGVVGFDVGIHLRGRGVRWPHVNTQIDDDHPVYHLCHFRVSVVQLNPGAFDAVKPLWSNPTGHSDGPADVAAKWGGYLDAVVMPVLMRTTDVEGLAAEVRRGTFNNGFAHPALYAELMGP